MRADEKLIAFLELESAIQLIGEICGICRLVIFLVYQKIVLTPSRGDRHDDVRGKSVRRLPRELT